MPTAILAVLAAAVFTAITTEVLPVGLLPEISAGLHTSESRVGLLVSGYAVVVALGAVPLAALAVRWPRQKVLCALLCLYAVSNAVMAGADGYWIALAARLLGGLAHAGFFSVVFAAAVDLAPAGRQGRAVAFVGIGVALGLALGVPLGTALGTAVGWRWAFALCTLAMVIFAGLTAIVLPAQHSPVGHRAQLPVLTAVRRGPLLGVAALVVVLTLGHYTAFTYVSPLLRHAGVHVGSVSLILFGYGAAGILGLVLAGVIVDRRPGPGLGGAAGLTAACLLVIGLDPGRGGTVVAVVVWGIAFGALPTLVQTIALRAAADAPDAAPAVVNAAFNVGIAGGALLGARELLRTQPPVLALTGAALAATVLLLLVAAPMLTRIRGRAVSS